MDIRCGSCGKLFRVADEKISGKGIRFKCSKCGEVITVTKQDFEMDLLAREGEAGPAPAVPPRPAAVAPQPPPSPPQLEPEPEAREYKPPPPLPEDEEEPVAQGSKAPDAPAAGLDDFDFSSPDVAAQHSQSPDAGLGDFALGESTAGEEEQEPAGELSLSEEDASAAEASLAFPADLISEPKRKSAFAAAAEMEPAAEQDASPALEQQADAGGLGEPAGDMGAIPDLGAPAEEEPLAPAAPPEPAQEPLSAPPAAPPPPASETAPPKGPVITPELLAQMKRAAPAKPAAQQKPAPAPAADDDNIDLGAALAIPKGAGTTPAGGEKPASAVMSAGPGRSSGGSGKRAIVLGAIAAALIAVLVALYFLGYLWGKSDQVAQQTPKKAPQEITAEGLAIADPAAYLDPEKGDLVVTGTVQNSLDRTKPGWYLVIDITDGSQKVVATVRVVNGVQIMTKRDYGILAKRGLNVDEIKAANAKAVRTAVVPAKGSVNFEARLYEPPADIAGFLPVLKTFDPEVVLEAVAKEAAL